MTDSQVIRVLLVEDFQTDAQLIERQIKKAEKHAVIKIVKEFDKVKEALLEFKPQLIISDYRLPMFSGLDVLQLTEKLRPGTIFLFLTGTINDEELAANTILSGASGYFLKKNINEFHNKLLPYFAAIKKNMSLTTRTRDIISNSRETLNKIESFLSSLDQSGYSKLEELKRIREDISKLNEEE